MPSAKALESVECPKCACRRNFVEESRILEVPYKGKLHIRIRRRRKCKNCGHGYYTTESVEPENTEGVSPNEVVVFNSLHVIEQTRPPSPLDSVRSVAPPPAPGDVTTSKALETLRNPYLDSSPKEEEPAKLDGSPPGAGNGSLGKQHKPRQKK